MNISYLAMTDIPSKNANSLQIVQMCSAFSALGHNVKLITPNFDISNNSSYKNYYGVKNKFDIIKIGNKKKRLSKLDNLILPFKLCLYSLKQKNNTIITRNLVVSLLLIILRKKHILEIHDDLKSGGKKISKIFRVFSLLNSSKIKKIIFITKNLQRFISNNYYFKKKKF